MFDNKTLKLDESDIKHFSQVFKLEMLDNILLNYPLLS